MNAESRIVEVTFDCSHIRSNITQELIITEMAYPLHYGEKLLVDEKTDTALL